MPDLPSPEDDQRRIAAGEERLAEVEGDIVAARQTHEETKKSALGGLIPDAGDNEGATPVEAADAEPEDATPKEGTAADG